MHSKLVPVPQVKGMHKTCYHAGILIAPAFGPPGGRKLRKCLKWKTISKKWHFMNRGHAR